MNRYRSKRFNFWEDYIFFTNPNVILSGFPAKIDCSFSLFRCRLYDGFDFKDRKELQYPPEHKCKRTGRANIPFHPVFYASYSKECAVNELKLKDKQLVALSEWKWNANVPVSVKLFSRNDQIFEQALKGLNISTINDYITLAEIKKGPITPESFHGEMIDRMHTICELFLNEFDYFGSAIVGYDELYRGRLNSSTFISDLLVYPSVISNEDVNVAIYPEIVDKYLDIQSVELIEVDDYGKFQKKFAL